MRGRRGREDEGALGGNREGEKEGAYREEEGVFLLSWGVIMGKGEVLLVQGEGRGSLALR